MAEILGLGVTHSPLLLGTDARMAGITERVLQSPRLPDHMRTPSGWPAPMRHEWEEHKAGRAALEDAGQQELLNWVCLAGAMDALGRKPDWDDLAETYIFAAPKAFVVFNPPLAQAAE